QLVPHPAIGAQCLMRRLTRLIRPTIGAASGNWRTMPDATLDASYQAYNWCRIGRLDKAFTPHPAIK
ncbi:hypothetical protein Q0S96_13445, partial [Escherichia coli OX25:H28]